MTDDFGLKLSSGGAHALHRIATRLGKIEAIAMVRWKTGMGLIESKNWIEQFLDRFDEQGGRQTAMSIVRATEWEVQKAVDEILNTNEWPIYKTDDDSGLEQSEYFEFVRACCRKLGLVSWE